VDAVSAFTIDLPKVLAKIRTDWILDGSADRDRARAWEAACRLGQDPIARAQAEAAAREQKKLADSYKRLEQTAHRRLAERRAKQAATRGPGWAVLPNPKVSHQELEALTHRVWDLAFHATPFPPGWKVRWASLAPSRAGQVVLGAVAMSARLVLLDEAAQAGRSWREMLSTVIHELAHVCHPQENHGAGFEETLRRVLAYVLPDEDELAAAAPAAARPPHHQPPLGARWTRHGWVAGADLDQTLEYRG
jgi:hypothetical protein